MGGACGPTGPSGDSPDGRQFRDWLGLISTHPDYEPCTCFAGDASVRGIIVACEIFEDFILAASFIENIRLVEYEISFSLRSVSGR